MPSGVTITAASITAVAPNSDIKTRALTYTLSMDPGQSAGIQTHPISSKLMTFAGSANEEIISKLVAFFGTNGGTLFKATGSNAIANTPPTSHSDTDLKALLVANGVDVSGAA